jgi:hypothetical protein
LFTQHLPKFLTTRDVLDFATAEGARATGLEHKVGTLTTGKEADIVLLRTDRINVIPINDPIGAVVWGMDTSDVHSVFVTGKPLNVDLNRVTKLESESRDFVIQAAEFTLPARCVYWKRFLGMSHSISSTSASALRFAAF